jgi:nitrogen fixation protein FixH
MIAHRGFTGRHMLAVMAGFFGVVISVNVAMATLAARTFGGTVVDNSYVASQQFNHWLARARAQDRLGWRARLDVAEDRRVTVALADHGMAMNGAAVGAIAHHPLGRESDVALRFQRHGPGAYISDRALPAGRWQVHLEVRRGASVLRLLETLS